MSLVCTLFLCIFIEVLTKRLSEGPLMSKRQYMHTLLCLKLLHEPFCKCLIHLALLTGDNVIGFLFNSCSTFSSSSSSSEDNSGSSSSEDNSASSWSSFVHHVTRCNYNMDKIKRMVYLFCLRTTLFCYEVPF